VTTGRLASAPTRGVATFPVNISGDRILVTIDN